MDQLQPDAVPSNPEESSDKADFGYSTLLTLKLSIETPLQANFGLDFAGVYAYADLSIGREAFWGLVRLLSMGRVLVLIPLKALDLPNAWHHLS